MSDNAHDHTVAAEPTLVTLLAGLQPMGDLDELAIDDLDAESAEAFFRILEDV